MQLRPETTFQHLILTSLLSRIHLLAKDLISLTCFSYLVINHTFNMQPYFKLNICLCLYYDQELIQLELLTAHHSVPVFTISLGKEIKIPHWIHSMLPTWRRTNARSLMTPPPLLKWTQGASGHLIWVTTSYCSREEVCSNLMQLWPLILQPSPPSLRLLAVHLKCSSKSLPCQWRRWEGLRCSLDLQVRSGRIVQLWIARCLRLFFSSYDLSWVNWISSKL